MNAKFIKHLDRSTNPEKLVKIRPVVPEYSCLRGRPIKIQKWIKKISAKCIALSAGIPSGLKHRLAFRSNLCDQKLSWSMTDIVAISDLNISKSSVSTPLRCGGIFKNISIANLLVNLSLQKFWKSVSIWRSYGLKSSVLGFFWFTVYMYIYWHHY